jgi:hypothetical protein
MTKEVLKNMKSREGLKPWKIGIIILIKGYKV